MAEPLTIRTALAKCIRDCPVVAVVLIQTYYLGAKLDRLAERLPAPVVTTQAAAPADAGAATVKR